MSPKPLPPNAIGTTVGPLPPGPGAFYHCHAGGWGGRGLLIRPWPDVVVQ